MTSTVLAKFIQFILLYLRYMRLNMITSNSYIDICYSCLLKAMPGYYSLSSAGFTSITLSYSYIAIAFPSS